MLPLPIVDTLPGLLGLGLFLLMLARVAYGPAD